MDKTFYTEENPIRFPYAAKYEGEREPETRVIVYYDIQDVSKPTIVFTNYDNSVKSIEVDGKETISLFVSGNVWYLFDTVGEHIIKYEFSNPHEVGGSAPFLYNVETAKRVVIPNTFAVINSNAFNTSSISSIVIPESIVTIRANAFTLCHSLTSVIIPKYVYIIGNNCFSNCTNLVSIKIYSKSVSWGIDVFSGCEHLKDVEINCDVGLSLFASTPLRKVIIGNDVKYINNRAFLNCDLLEDLKLGDSVDTISNEAFKGCANLKSVSMPDSMHYINEGAFANCTNLTSVVIESRALLLIGLTAFLGCDKLTSIIILCTIAPSVNNNTFRDVGVDGVLTVPRGSVGYDQWMQTVDYFLGKYNWTMVEQ